MWSLFVSKLSSSPDAIIGVGLIGIYFCWMMYMSVMRIMKGDHMDH